MYSLVVLPGLPYLPQLFKKKKKFSSHPNKLFKKLLSCVCWPLKQTSQDVKSPLLTLPPRQLWSFIFFYLCRFLQSLRTIFTHSERLQKLDVKITNQFFFFTKGTSLSTTVFRISIHSVRFCLLMSSRGRLYCRESLFMGKKKDGSTVGYSPESWILMV